MLALDLFAGTGWGVALQRLGITEHGAEIMPQAVQSRWRNGMLTPYGDVSKITAEQAAAYPIHIGSPPCQTYSRAGKGKGREQLERVLQGVQALACGWPWHPTDDDPRTWLVLEPLRLALAGRPVYIAWEQVDTVLPVWDACAEVLRERGYSVWTGMLQAEMYGVPQTRKRAFLLARRDGREARPPVPTHSRYYTRDPSKLDDGVRPWVSMAEALGWGVTRRPSFTVTGGGSGTGGAEPFGNAARQSLIAYRNGTQANSAERSSLPAPTVHFGARSNWVNVRPATTVQGDPRIAAAGHHDRQMNNSIRVSVQEAAILQTYPAGFRFAGSGGAQYQQIGNAVPPLLAEAVLVSLLDLTCP